MKRIKIGTRWIGEKDPCFIIAEAGSNHNGSLDNARRLIDVAADAGADAVKFQCFKAEKLYTRAAGASDYLKDSRSIFDIIKSMELSEPWIPALADHCRSRKVEFLCTPFDEEAVDMLDPWLPAIKIASYEITHLPLVRYAAQKKKPLIVSTGAASLAEVRKAVDTIRQTGLEDIILLQCTARYPVSLPAINARALVELQKTFGTWAGLSDHSREPAVAPVVAVSLGARVIEKHFTLDNRMDGPDHKFSVEPEELKLMVRMVRDAECALGHGRKEILPEEAELHAFARRSIFVVRRIDPGDRLTRENVRVLRCGKKGFGLSPEEFDHVLGKLATHEILEGSLIQWKDIS